MHKLAVSKGFSVWPRAEALAFNSVIQVNMASVVCFTCPGRFCTDSNLNDNNMVTSTIFSLIKGSVNHTTSIHR